jgi:PKD repeat protein
MKKNLLITIFTTLFAMFANAQSPCACTISITYNPGGAATLTATPNAPNANQTFSWSLGNGTAAYGQTVTTTYNNNGAYVVCVTVVDSVISGGCTYTTCDSVLITNANNLPSCSASYYIVPDSMNSAPHTYLGYNASTGSGLSYLWYWGDGDSSTGFAPSHTYAAAGNYLLCLMVSNGTCKDTFCATQAINKKQNDPFSINFVDPMAVQNISKEQLALYPNPTKDAFYLQLDNSTWTVNVFDVFGKKVLTQTVKGKEAISVTNLNNGSYFISAKSNNGKNLHTQFSVLK